MALEKELKIQSIVIVAQNFNPSVFNRHWLVKNNFIKEELILSNSIFASGITQVVTENFTLLVMPEQLQFNISHEFVNFESQIENTLLPIINKLLEIPYTGVGLNFNWFVKDREKGIPMLSKEMFFVNESSLFQDFNSDNSRFGSYISKDFGITRLKLDIKPVNVLDHRTKISSDHLHCSFNFHLDLNPETGAEKLVETILVWSKYKEESQRIIELL